MDNSGKFFGKVLVFATLMGAVVGFRAFATNIPTIRADANRKVPERVRIKMGQKLTPRQRDIVNSARRLLNEAPVSYAYGGNRLGTQTDCAACNDCLALKSPKPANRFKECPVCSRCSLDCSHFTKLIFQRAGLDHPYMTTKDMLSLPSNRLNRDFGFFDLPPDPASAAPGDLLVYKGHVVMLERKQGNGRGDVIHATGGRDIKDPGQGIQRERWAELSRFRGPLLRILRHKALVSNNQDR